MRKTISELTIAQSMLDLEDWTLKRLSEKGFGTFVSSHEARGIIHEEVIELFEAFSDKNPAEIEHELKDVALACLKQKTMDW